MKPEVWIFSFQYDKKNVTNQKFVNAVDVFLFLFSLHSVRVILCADS